ncbi:MAG: TlyA family RNA methyltransferase [Bradymonadales bacterium]|nr:TlyA family RNA methyltransferase [Bradymonadales bacterium]
MGHNKLKRLDILVVERGLAESRSRASGLIMAGQIQVDGQVVTKAGTRFSEEARLELAVQPDSFVSRGGLKLEAALAGFGIDVNGRVALDIGASTGGFTDCLLQRGAARVYAVDVGYGQLHWSLRQDSRVVVMERRNARYLTTDDLCERCDLAVFDLAFISLDKVVPAVLPLLTPAADLVMLVKPQFEATVAEVGKGGVIRDPEVRQAVIARAIGRLTSLGLQERARMDSPIAGPKGNLECLVWFTRTDHG